jgi:hypothetical protein
MYGYGLAYIAGFRSMTMNDKYRDDERIADRSSEL